MRTLVGLICLAGMILIAGSVALAASDPGRQREELEKYPIESLQLAGTLNLGGQQFGLIRAPNQLVYRVKVGSYVGDHEGRVTAIATDVITVSESAPDGTERRIRLKSGTPTRSNAQTAETFASDCENEIRAHAFVTEITGRGQINGGARYQIVFRGEAGSTVKAECQRANGMPIVSYTDIEQNDRPHWGVVGRPKTSPVGASLCDSEAQNESFYEQLHSDDSRRMIARRVSRKGDTLSLRLDDGKQTQLTDQLRGCSEGAPNCTRYRFWEWRAKEHAYVIYVVDYENTFFLIVDARDGERTPLSGYPVWSPSGDWIALSGGESGGFDNVSLEIQRSRKPDDKSAFHQDYGSGPYCIAGWNDERSLDVRAVIKGRPGELYKHATRKLEFDGETWRWLEPVLDAH